MSVMTPGSSVIEHFVNEAPVQVTRAAKKTSATPYFQWKGVLDRVAAAIILIPALPLMLMLFALVRLTSRGPALFQQERVGLNGKPFTMYKIRSMYLNAESLSGPVWASARDPRATPLGRVLRKLHLDELPQLFNVLFGEMSLVGPRPERPEFTQCLEKDVPHYSDRFLVRPGVTGLAQVNLPPDTDLDGVRRKLALDLEYIHTGGLWLDARILVCTCFRLTGLSSAHLVRLMGLRRLPKPFVAREHVNGHAGGAPVKPR